MRLDDLDVEVSLHLFNPLIIGVNRTFIFSESYGEDLPVVFELRLGERRLGFEYSVVVNFLCDMDEFFDGVYIKIHNLKVAGLLQHGYPFVYLSFRNNQNFGQCGGEYNDCLRFGFNIPDETFNPLADIGERLSGGGVIGRLGVRLHQKHESR